jgi:predicted DsbA family dithiol-disulfide isomerase
MLRTGITAAPQLLPPRLISRRPAPPFPGSGVTASPITIDVWSDVACPWCYIGKRKLEAAVAQFALRDQVQLTWHSFQLDPSAPAVSAQKVTEMLGRKYGLPPAQVTEMMNRVDGAAREVGLKLRLADSVLGNTFDAHRLIHFAASKGQQDAAKERLFQAYFVEGLPVGDHATLQNLAAELGYDAGEVADMLGSGQFTEAVKADLAQARANGITGVPFFVFQKRYAVSGAQPTATLLQILQRVAAELPPEVVAPAADQCDDDGCAV